MWFPGPCCLTLGTPGVTLKPAASQRHDAAPARGWLTFSPVVFHLLGWEAETCCNTTDKAVLRAFPAGNLAAESVLGALPARACKAPQPEEEPPASGCCWHRGAAGTRPPHTALPGRGVFAGRGNRGKANLGSIPVPMWDGWTDGWMDALCGAGHAVLGLAAQRGAFRPGERGGCTVPPRDVSLGGGGGPSCTWEGGQFHATRQALGITARGSQALQDGHQSTSTMARAARHRTHHGMGTDGMGTTARVLQHQHYSMGITAWAPVARALWHRFHGTAASQHGDLRIPCRSTSSKQVELCEL